MSKQIRAYWFRPPEGGQNLGDALAPILLAAMGYTPDTRGEEPCLFSIGTLLCEYYYRQSGSDHIVVWGSGAGYQRERAQGGEWSGRLDIRAVRGPQTRQLLGLPQDTPLGDPALLFPFLDLSFPSVAGGEILWMPHWTNVGAEAPDGATALQPTFLPPSDARTMTANALYAVARIASAEFVLAESLHAAILAHTYGVPWAPVTMDGKGGEAINLYKWSDWLGYLGLSEPLTFVCDAAQARAWWDRVGRHRRCSDPKVLFRVFPSEIGRSQYRYGRSVKTLASVLFHRGSWQKPTAS